MNILEKIIANKQHEVALKKSLISASQLENSVLFNRKTYSLTHNLKNSNNGIIAEHKRRSPSKGEINHQLSVQEIVKGYEDAAVSGISVLTDSRHFGGSLDDLILARATVKTPLLRKEFIIDEYQLLEAKAYGADVILLIAAVLSKNQIKNLSIFAKKLELEVLLEIHNQEELDQSIMPSLDMIGVNNRNLKTFEVSLETSMQLSEKIPTDFFKISESGIYTVDDIKLLKTHGFKGFLIGENFMRTENPGKSALNFIKNI